MKKYKIAVAEDDEDEQIFIKDGFENTGLFEIIKLANNGEELINWLRLNVHMLPELIISDLNMPAMNGYDVIRQVRMNPFFGNVPIIILSTSSVKEGINKCLSLGASDYITKPNSFADYKILATKLYHTIADKYL